MFSIVAYLLAVNVVQRERERERERERYCRDYYYRYQTIHIIR